MTPGRGECPLCGIEVSGVRDENDRFLPIRGAGHLDNCLYSKSMMGELEKTGPKRMRRVYLESPWAGDTVTNYAYAIRAMLDCLRRGEAPFASHIFYAHSGVLDDLVPAERALGIQAGLAWAEAADATVVYMDRGVSPGMQLGIDAAEKAGRPVERRWLVNT